MLDEAGVKVFTGQRLRERDGVACIDHAIDHLTTEDGTTFSARVFVDASYEGDLMAQAGVGYVVGREAVNEYGEPSAGVRKMQKSGVPGAARDEQGVLPGVLPREAGAVGAGDGKIQSYNFRLCLTRDPANRVAIEKSAGYDQRAYTIAARWLEAHPELKLVDVVSLVPLPNGKVDANNFGKVSSDWVNASFGYPDGTYARRAEIWYDHRNYVQGLWWFLANDPRCPERIRAEAAPWGLARDEFVDTDHWPPQMYIREGRRMAGAYLVTEHDLRRDIVKSDGVGMGSYRIDSHFVQRFLLPDGDWGIEGWVGGDQRVLPYQIPYRSLTPRREQCTNLLVPLCLSATHAAWMSIRMEPVFMIMGHSAGVAAAMAAKARGAVQDVDVTALRAKLLAQKQVLAYDPPGHIDPAKLGGVVVEEDDAAGAELWITSNSESPFVGLGYRHDRNQFKGQRKAKYVPNLPRAGEYEVRMFYAPSRTRASNVPVTIESAGGKIATLQVDQRTTEGNSERGRSLGVFHLDAGRGGSVTVSNDGTDGTVIIDAVQFLPVGK
jgi:hypothetical protein